MSLEIVATVVPALVGALLSLTKALFPVFEEVEKILSKVFKETYKNIDDNSETVDERIQKIDVAKENLLEGLKAIDELKIEAQTNKRQLQEALENLQKTVQAKQIAEEDLKNIQKVLSSDVTTFQRLIGQPNQAQINKERTVGFVVGVFSSLVASLVIYGFAQLWPVLMNLL